MHSLRGSLIWRYVAIYVAASMAVPYAVVGFPANAGAQPQPVVRTVTCIVLPLLDPTGLDTEVLSEKATDAMALALEDSREFVVTSKRDLERELGNLGMTTPLSVEEQVRLAKRLDVEKVLTGRVTALAVDGRTGECAVKLQVRVLDTATVEYLQGTEVAIRTKVVPGWTGDESQVINEALRQAAETVTMQMLGGRITTGYVTSVNDVGVAIINVGAGDGVLAGTEMVLMRPTYQKDLDVMTTVKVGTVAVGKVASDMCYARPVAGGRAKVGDRAYALYKPPVRLALARRSKGISKAATLVAALGLVFALVEVGSGEHVGGAPEGVCANLYQQSPGDEAVIRIHVPNQWVPLTEQIHGWLFFRKEGTPSLALSPENLVGVVDESRLPGNVWDDYPESVADLQIAYGFIYYNEEGEQEDGDVDIVYNHPPLEEGSTYYYRVRRITEPQYPAGSGAPITAQQVGTQQQVFVEPSIDVDPYDALSEGSAPTNPVTYFNPTILQSPDDGAQNQSTTSITFTWDGARGANEYLLQVFPDDDPDCLRNAVHQSPVMRQGTAGTMHWTIDANFTANSRFYWRVGARRSGEAEPVNGFGNQTGWLFSSTRSFRTAVAPPPPPGTSSASGQAGVTVRRGFFTLPRYEHE